mmetsp:Transcript_138402/g.442278  ORF Transcript_138402/g.442278 Transcript_138402/m.442278 type:complete len:287 (+) Transcript_138402:5547-6407(+)
MGIASGTSSSLVGRALVIAFRKQHIWGVEQNSWRVAQIALVSSRLGLGRGTRGGGGEGAGRGGGAGRAGGRRGRGGGLREGHREGAGPEALGQTLDLRRNQQLGPPACHLGQQLRGVPVLAGPGMVPAEAAFPPSIHVAAVAAAIVGPGYVEVVALVLAGVEAEDADAARRGEATSFTPIGDGVAIPDGVTSALRTLCLRELLKKARTAAAAGERRVQCLCEQAECLLVIASCQQLLNSSRCFDLSARLSTIPTLKRSAQRLPTHHWRLVRNLCQVSSPRGARGLQ